MLEGSGRETDGYMTVYLVLTLAAFLTLYLVLIRHVLRRTGGRE